MSGFEWEAAGVEGASGMVEANWLMLSSSSRNESLLTSIEFELDFLRFIVALESGVETRLMEVSFGIEFVPFLPFG